jgi:hypothetical protein
MKISSLKTLIKECITEIIKEEFGDDGWMRAVNVRENANSQSKPVGAFGSEAFFESETGVLSLFNNTETPIKVTVQKRGNSFYVQLDK